MNDEAQEKRGPGRPRAEEVRQRRRRRGDTSETRDMKLFVPEGEKDPDFEYRWINDVDGGTRIRNMTVHDDWDIVETKTIDNDAEGSKVARGVGTDEHGKGQRAYLCRKPKKFYEEDYRAKQARLDAREEEMRRGPTRESGLAPDEAYVPQGHQNVIRKGA
jgi:hypothetical protein